MTAILSKRSAMNGTLIIARTEQGTVATIVGRPLTTVTKALMQKVWTEKRSAFSPFDPATNKFTRIGGSMPGMDNV